MNQPTNNFIATLERRLALQGLTAPENKTVVRAALLIAFIAMLFRIVFWAYTMRYWEDALITCLHSENFASGLGLTHYRPGESPLHGFTSPFSVLVPLIGDLLHVGFGIEFLKLVSIPAAALTVLFVLAIAIHPNVKLPTPLAILAMGYVAIEHHQILFGMAGMETQLSTLILIASIYYTIAWKPIPIGITLGLCMLVRPDYGFWTLIVGTYALFKEPKQLTRIVPIALAVYLPWILFTLWHYGSPLPNTIVAKGLGYAKWWDGADALTFQGIKRRTWVMLSEQLHILFAPTFSGHGAGQHIFFTKGFESPLANLMFLFTTIGTLTIFIKRQTALIPLAACAIGYSIYYVYFVPVVFSWYKIPYIATMLLLSVRGIQATASLIPKQKTRNITLAGYTAAYLALFLGVLPWTFHTERQIQRTVENQIRKPAGLYLAEHMKENEAVGCEPLGYMSYYSRGNVYDWPGLASRTVVAWSKEHPDERSLEGMLKGLQPEYLFLRDLEMLYWFKDPDWFKQYYHVVKIFQLTQEQRHNIPWIDRNVDTSFRIYRKNHPEDELPYELTFPTLPENAPGEAPAATTWSQFS